MHQQVPQQDVRSEAGLFPSAGASLGGKKRIQGQKIGYKSWRKSSRALSGLSSICSPEALHVPPGHLSETPRYALVSCPPHRARLGEAAHRQVKLGGVWPTLETQSLCPVPPTPCLAAASPHQPTPELIPHQLGTRAGKAQQEWGGRMD